MSKIKPKESKELPNVNGTFSKVVWFVDSSNIKSYVHLTITVESGQVTSVHQSVANDPQIIFGTASQFLRLSSDPLHEVVK